MADKLVIREDCVAYIATYYRIVWELDGDDMDTGAILGQETAQTLENLYENLDNYKEDDYDKHIVASVAVLRAGAFDEHHDTAGFAWHNRKGATRALQIARNAIKAYQAKVPWPDWAVKAVAAGWKPPRTWRP